MEIQQSPLYAKYIQSLGWSLEHVDGTAIYIRNIFLMGALAKIQRPRHLPLPKTLIPLFQKYHVKTVALEPSMDCDTDELHQWVNTMNIYFKLNRSPFLPTKTIEVDLKVPKDSIFQRFSDAKRRAVRRAQKNGIVIEESMDMQNFIKIKNRSAGFLGFITTYGLKNLWNFCIPRHATILLAYTPKRKIIGGILLIFWNKRAYYWVAGATHQGKKLFAPTLLVWEALRVSKERNCTTFDFVGVWDERLPKENGSWKGFTKFKEGFGGKEIYYPIVN